MDEAARKRLEAVGFKSVTVAEFLGLTPEEEALVEIKAALSKRLRELRQARGLTQDSFGEELGVTQSRVARLERADPGVSTELLIRALLKSGATREELGRLIAGEQTREAA
jgi:predicted transcriptional regulator